MNKREIIERLKNIARHARHTVGEEPFVMSLDDGIAVYEAVELLEKPEMNCSEIPNNWIPCSERLPEDDTEVLVYLFENNKSPYIAWLSDGRWYTEYFEVEREDEPVAWMPLPEPYKGEQG